MDALTLLLNTVLTAFNIAVVAFQGWREWRAHRQPAAHPLDARLRDLDSTLHDLTTALRYVGSRFRG